MRFARPKCFPRVFSPAVLTALLIVNGVIPFVAFGVLVGYELRLHGLLPCSRRKVAVSPSLAAIKPLDDIARIEAGGSSNDNDEGKVPIAGAKGNTPIGAKKTADAKTPIEGKTKMKLEVAL